jgi:hypothetical protein
MNNNCNKIQSTYAWRATKTGEVLVETVSYRKADSMPYHEEEILGGIERVDDWYCSYRFSQFQKTQIPLLTRVDPAVSKKDLEGFLTDVLGYDLSSLNPQPNEKATTNS